MAVRWQAKSETVHRSTAIWVGQKPKDGGLSMLLEALAWAREHAQQGKMTLHLGMGGSISGLEFEQREAATTPEPDDEDEAIGALVPFGN